MDWSYFHGPPGGAASAATSGQMSGDQMSQMGRMNKKFSRGGPGGPRRKHSGSPSDSSGSNFQRLGGNQRMLVPKLSDGMLELMNGSSAMQVGSLAPFFFSFYWVRY